MESTTIFRYVQSNKDEAYALQVIYYLMRKALIKNDFNLQKIPFIKISGKFRLNPINVDIRMLPSHELDGLMLLLFIRTIMIDSSYMDLCVDELPLFRRKSKVPYEWIDWLNIINECGDDEDFNEILECINTYNYSDALTEEEVKKFEEKTVRPEYKYILNYYRTMADNSEECEEVVKSNAYVCDDGITDFSSDENICYIGDTAFAFCSNLSSITFNNPNILFGHFPIVECENLKHIYVPEDSINYYKKELPYYTSIISSIDDINTEVTNQPEIETTEQTTVEETRIEEEKEEVIPQVSEEKAKVEEKKPVIIDRNTIYDVFKNVSTSYKYFWFMAFLSIIKRKGHQSISFQEMVAEMMGLVWPVIYEFDLDLGKTDSFSSISKALIKGTPLIEQSSSNIVRQYISNHYDVVKKIVSPLLDNVPYQFLSPWIKFISNSDVVEKSNDVKISSPYAIIDDSIVFDEDWYEYIKDNHGKLEKFVYESFLKYLGKHNSVMELLKYKISIAQK